MTRVIEGLDDMRLRAGCSHEELELGQKGSDCGGHQQRDVEKSTQYDLRMLE